MKFTELSKNELRNYVGGYIPVIGIITLPAVHVLPKILQSPVYLYFNK